MFDVNTSLIRFWEKEFPTVKPKKNKKGNRLFTPKDIIKLDNIYELVKIKGYTLEGAKKAMKTGVSDEDLEQNQPLDTTELINKLEEVRSTLLKMKA